MPNFTLRSFLNIVCWNEVIFDNVSWFFFFWIFIFIVIIASQHRGMGESKRDILIGWLKAFAKILWHFTLTYTRNTLNILWNLFESKKQIIEQKFHRRANHLARMLIFLSFKSIINIQCALIDHHLIAAVFNVCNNLLTIYSNKCLMLFLFPYFFFYNDICEVTHNYLKCFIRIASNIQKYPHYKRHEKHFPIWYVCHILVNNFRVLTGSRKILLNIWSLQRDVCLWLWVWVRVCVWVMTARTCRFFRIYLFQSYICGVVLPFTFRLNFVHE